MNWGRWRLVPWIDSRSRFVAAVRRGGRLLDLGTSDGRTLCHFAELRPDLRFAAVDLRTRPALMPAGSEFARADLETDRLDWPDESFDAITCMHLVEHLDDTRNLWSEAARLLRPGGKIYVETPAPKSLTLPSEPGSLQCGVTMNFHDDDTHVAVVPVAQMRTQAERVGLEERSSGTARNWGFALAYLVLRLFPPRRKRYIAKLHWIGWSDYFIAAKPKIS